VVNVVAALQALGPNDRAYRPPLAFTPTSSLRIASRGSAANGGRAPAELRPWLPWRMTEAERAALQLPGEAGPKRPEDTS